MTNRGFYYSSSKGADQKGDPIKNLRKIKADRWMAKRGWLLNENRLSNFLVRKRGRLELRVNSPLFI